MILQNNDYKNFLIHLKQEIIQARKRTVKEKQRQAAIEFLERMDRENGNVGNI